jgi:diadenosine tetraphosphatase ApaH/serine/threonine PP2A family protein phosphatase
MGRTICIGDIHGCIETLQILLKTLELTQEDTFISLGDLFHKRNGYGHQIIQILKNLNCNVKFIFANHEDKHYRWYIKTEEERRLMTWVEDFEKEGLTREDIDWLLEGYLYYSFIINDQKYMCVHGGIAPEHIDLKDELLIKDLFQLSSTPRKSLEKILRTRYITPTGKSVKDIHSITQYDTYWAEIYEGRYGTVIFGHQPFLNSMGPRIFPYAIGLDTGCVHGGALTALILEEGAPIRSLSVKNPVSYCPSIFSPHKFPI